MLSVAFDLDRKTVSFDEALEFNYRLSQGREQTAARLRVPHPSDNLDSWHDLSEHVRAGIPQAPQGTAPINEQLGQAGGSFTLIGLILELLRPLEKAGFRVVQDELSTYTIARFGEAVDLQIHEVCADLAPFLSALSQVEEPSHAGEPRGTVGVENAILNRRHWVGVGLLGAAHIIADQPPENHSFNSARAGRVLLKYYIPYLLALLQRLTLHRIIDEAGLLVASTDNGSGSALVELRKHLLDFAVTGHFTEVSNRAVLHRYYRLCQCGLDVPTAMNYARQAIADLDAKRTAENQTKLANDTAQSVATTRKLQREMAKNVESTKNLQEQMTQHLGIVARVQLIVEWLEIFIISVAAADLWHLFSSENRSWFPRWAEKLFGSREWFVSWGVIVVALFAAAVALAFIRPWRHRKHMP